MISSGVDSITLAVNSLCNEHNWGRGGLYGYPMGMRISCL